MAQIDMKRSVEDVWPLKKKRVFVLADFESLMGMQTAISTGVRLGAASLSSLNTIQRVVDHDGVAIVGVSFGGVKGQPMNFDGSLQHIALEAWKQERGMGLTQYFSKLNAEQKMNVLLSCKYPTPEFCAATNNTGKTRHFAQLPLECKIAALAQAGFHVDRSEEATARPLCELLQHHIHNAQSVTFLPDPLAARETVLKALPGSVIFLENLRFYTNETSSSGEARYEMARILASYADVYVNDSFCSAHETLASTVELPAIMRHGCAGMLLNHELRFFQRWLKHCAAPIAVVVGGSNLQEKLQSVAGLIHKVDKIFVAGAVGIPFTVAKGFSGGKAYPKDLRVSWCGELVSPEEFAKRAMAEAAKAGVKLITPTDYILSNGQIVSDSFPAEECVVDVGPSSVSTFCRELDDCGTVYWVGALGVQDDATAAVAHSLIQHNVQCVVGGRRASAVLRERGLYFNIGHLTSGSSSVLHVLQGLPLHGVSQLTDCTTPVADVEKLKDLLCSVPLLAQCSKVEKIALAARAIRRDHSKGDVLLRKGDHVSSMWIVARGCFSAYTDCGAPRCRSIRAGEAIGSYDFVTQQCSPETIFASVDSVTYQLSRSALCQVLLQSEDMLQRLFLSSAQLLGEEESRRHATQTSRFSIMSEELQGSRKPLPMTLVPPPQRSQFLLSACTDIVCAIALHQLTLQYAPFYQTVETYSSFAWRYNGLPMRLTFTLLRNSTFSNFVEHNPWAMHRSSAQLGVLSLPRL